MRKERVVVGMSGGVDSSVAACLLKEAGYEVIGVTMQIWPKEDPSGTEEGCCGESAVEDARRAAASLGIPHYVMNFREKFKKQVMDDFAREYLAGRTPNPCIVCNRHIKWEALLKRSMELGADYIATGHYARIRRLENGRLALCQAASGAKDQTYALYSLTQEQLAHTLMPVGDYEKSEIRRIAREMGLSTTEKPDSMEICFVPDQDYAGFIERYTGRAVPEGNFVTAKGEILGKHRGIIHYTIGQRKGLGLSLGKPAFVTEIRPETNEVVVGDGEDVYAEGLVCRRLNFMGLSGLQGETRLKVKIRYSHPGEDAVVRLTGPDQAEVRFSRPVRAVTPGQAAVFYREDWVAGGGTIVGKV